MTTTPEIMPFIHVQGSWGDMGRQVGQMFAPLIDRHVEAWLGHVRAESGCSREAALATAMSYAPAIQSHAPFLWEEIDGIARGAGLPIDQVMLLQARAEVMRHQKDQKQRRSSARRSRWAATAPPAAPCSTARTWTWCRSWRSSAW